MSDDLLERATRGLRDAYDGESKATDDTLERVLETLEAKKSAPGARVFAWTGSSKTKRTVLRTAAALAATLALTTAWAASTGRLGRIFEAGEPGEPEAPAEPQRPERGTKATSMPPAPAVQEIPAAPEAEPPPAIDPAPAPATLKPAATSPSARTNVARTNDVQANDVRANDARSNAPAPASAQGSAPSAAVVDAPAPPAPPAPAASAVDPNDVAFERAHRLHFDGNYADALVAWDTYLQNAPNGRFAPEARFNRAIALWKLGRKDEAKQALEPFARGAYGDYRRDEARRLLEAADR